MSTLVFTKVASTAVPALLPVDVDDHVPITFPPPASALPESSLMRVIVAETDKPDSFPLESLACLSVTTTWYSAFE